MSKKKKTNVDGIRNKFEAQVFKGLQSFKGTEKFKVDYEAEKIPYTLSFEYIPDFKLEFKDGRVMYIESKGYFPYEDQRKMVNVIAQHPDKDIRMLFMKDNKLSRTSKKRYSDWCVKNKIPFAIGEIPSEWFE